MSLKTWTAVTIMAISAYIGTSSSEKMKKAEEVLMKVPAYNYATRLENLSNRVYEAKENLEYHAAYTTIVTTGKITIPVCHPASYPKAAKASETLEQVAKAGIIDKDQASRLHAIATNLPKEDSIRVYEGRSVNNQTFSAKREQLARESAILKNRSNAYMSEVPENLKIEKSKQNRWLLGSIASGITAAGYMIFRRRQPF